MSDLFGNPEDQFSRIAASLKLNICLQGHEAFFEAQQHVATVLQKQHYPSFLVSDICHRYVKTLEEDMPDSVDTTNKGELCCT